MYRYMDHEQKRNSEEILRFFKNHDGTISQGLVKKLLVGSMFADQNRHLYERSFNALYAKALLESSRATTPCLPLRRSESDGIVLGTTIQGVREYGKAVVKPQSMVHTFLGGMSGAGKSNLAWGILQQLSQNNCNLKVFDRKREARYMLRKVPLAIFEPRDLRINMFEPPIPQMDVRAWQAKVCDLFPLFGLMHGSRNFIKKKVMELQQETKEIPSLYDVYQSMDSKRERGITNTGYRDASLNKIENLVEELPCFNVKKSAPMMELLNISFAIEVDRLSMQAERFLVAYFLLVLLETRKALSIRGNPGLDSESTYLFVDDASSLWNPQLDRSEMVQDMSFNVLQEFPLVARDFKICLIFSSQRPLSKNIMSNAKTMIISGLPDDEDQWHLSNSMGIDPSIFQRLNVGEFAVRSGNDEPFLIRTKRIEREMIDDETLEKLKRPLVQYMLENSISAKKSESKNVDVETLRLDREAKKLLCNVINYPSMTVTQRYDALSLKGSYAQYLKRYLIEKKMVEEVYLAIGSSKQSTFLVPTQRAIEYVRNSEDVDAAFYSHVGHTSPIHQLVQAMIIEYFTKSGYRVSNDVYVGDKAVDVLVKKDRAVVFEVAANPSIDVDRVRSALDDVDLFVVVATDLLVLNGIERSLEQVRSDKIRILPASSILTRMKDGVLNYNTLISLEQQNRENGEIGASNEAEQQKKRDSR